MQFLRGLLVAAVLFLASCSRSPSGPDEPVAGDNGPMPAQVAGAAPIKKLEGGWLLNRAWQGYMGVAILFRADGTFDYWAYSDVVVPDAPKYPVAGTWRWDGAVLRLESEHHLHDTRWHVYPFRGENCLLPDYAKKWQEADGKPHDDRLLFRIAEFDPAAPFDKRR
jgi:hypothetical protein